MSLFRTFLIGGLFLASMHTCWVILVALGLAQPLLDFVFKLHVLNSPFHIEVFDPLLATGLVCMTFLIGCFYGAIFHIINSKLLSR